MSLKKQVNVDSRKKRSMQELAATFNKAIKEGNVRTVTPSNRA